MSNQETTILHRFGLDTQPSELLDMLEATEDKVWLSRTQVCRRFTLRGVPARLVDVLVDFDVLERGVDPRDGIAIEVARKSGHFDGAGRWRITVRTWRGSNEPLPPGEVSVAEDGAELTVIVRSAGDGWSAGEWSETFHRLRSSLDDYNVARIYMWHRQRYYTHLGEMSDDERQHADAWAVEYEAAIDLASVSLAEANRAASRALYRRSRDEGWIKLSLRERIKLGLDGGMWRRESVVATARAMRTEFRASGVGDATAHAATTGSWQ